MFVRPAFRWLHGAISVSNSAITGLVWKQELEDGLKEVGVEVQWDVYQCQLGILDGDHDVSCNSEGQRFSVGRRNIKTALRNAMRDIIQPQQADTMHKLYFNAMHGNA